MYNFIPLLVGLAHDCKQTLRVYDFSSKSERLATDIEKREYSSLKTQAIPSQIAERRVVEGVRHTKTENNFAWVENENPDIYLGFSPPQRLNAYVDGEIYHCAHLECLRRRSLYGPQLWWSNDGAEIYFHHRDGWNASETGIYAWSPVTDNLRTVYKSQDSWLADCSIVKKSLVCLHENLKAPRKIVSISLENGSLKTLYDPNPELANRHFSKIEKLEWEDRFGGPTHGFLVYPIDYDPDQTYPLVFVTYTSRRFLRGGVGDEYPIHPLAAEGFFVLSHHRPFNQDILMKEKDSMKALFENLHWRKSVLSSQEIIVKLLGDRGLIDIDRVALTGLSEGAAQVFFALIHSDKFAAFISSGGSVSPGAFYRANRSVRNLQSSWLRGAPDDPNSYWSDIAIENNADKINSPLLMNVLDMEAIGAIQHAGYLQEADKPVEMYIFPDAHHIKWRPDQRLAIYRRNIQWLKFWLQDAEVDDPVSPGQYDRWRAMRANHCANMKARGKNFPTYCAAVPAE